MKPIFVILIMILLCSAQPSLAGGPLHDVPDDTAKVSLLIRLSEKANDLDSALLYVTEAVEAAQRISFTEGIARSLVRRGAVNNQRSDFAGATRDLLEAIKIGEQLKSNYIIIKGYLNLGTTYAYRSEWPKAIDYFSRGLEKARNTGDKKNEATLLNNLGNVYYYSGYQTDNFEPALENYSEALAIYESLADTIGISMVLDNLGLVYADQDNFSGALAVLQRSYDLALRTNRQESIMYCLSKFSRLHAQMKDYSRAFVFLEQTIELARKLKRTDMIMTSYQHYADIYANLRDYPNAYKYQLMYTQIRDTLLNEKSSEQIAEMQAKYESEKKEKELVILKQENMATEMEASRSRTMLWISIGGGTVLLTVAMVIGLLIHNRYKIKKKANLQLSMQNDIIAQKNKDITDSINYAKRLQRSVITTDAYLARHLPEHFVLYKPKDIVSGDFYWAFSPAAGEVIVATADCTGHGVPGAFMSVLGASLLNDIIAERKVLHPNLALNLLRDNLIKMLNPVDSSEETRDGMDITLCRFNFEKLTLSVAAANNPLWIARDNEMLEVKPDRFPVGKHSGGSKSFTLKNIQLNKGDVIYSFTDGYADQFGGPHGKKLKYKELQAILLSIKDRSMSEQKRILEQKFETWRNDLEQVDDVTVIGIRV